MTNGKRRRYRLIIILALAHALPRGNAMGQVDSLISVWEREVVAGTAVRNSQFVDVATAGDGSVFAVGSTRIPEGLNELLLVKYDPLGRRVWETRHRDPAAAPDGAAWLFANPDGGAVLLGTLPRPESGLLDLSMLRFGADGELVLSRVYSTPSDTARRDFLQAVRDSQGCLYVLANEVNLQTWFAPVRPVILKISPTGGLLAEIRLPDNEQRSASWVHMAFTSGNRVQVVGTRADSTVRTWGGPERSCLYTFSTDGELIACLEQAPAPGPSSHGQGLAAGRDGHLRAVVFDMECRRFITVYGRGDEVLWTRQIDSCEWGWLPGNTTVQITPDSVVWILRTRDRVESVERYSMSGEILSVWQAGTTSWYPTGSWQDADGGIRTMKAEVRSDDLPNDTLRLRRFGPAGILQWNIGIPVFAQIPGETGALDREGSLFVGFSAGAGRDVDARLLKIRADGSVAWESSHTSEGSPDLTLADMAITPSGDVVLTGISTNLQGYLDIFTARIDAAGDLRWVRRYDGKTGFHDVALSVFLDSAGNATVAGSAPSRSTWWATSNGHYTVLKYSPDGALLWTAEYGTGNPECDRMLLDAGVDPQGRVWLAGSAGTAVVDAAGGVHTSWPGPSSLVRTNSRGEAFIVGDSLRKYSATGTPLWSAHIESADGMMPAADGGVLVTSAGSGWNQAALARRVDSAGGTVWTRYGGGNSITVAHDGTIMVTNPEGRVFRYTMAGDSLPPVFPFSYISAGYCRPALGSDGVLYHAMEGATVWSEDPLLVQLVGISSGGGVEVMRSIEGRHYGYRPRLVRTGDDNGIYLGLDADDATQGKRVVIRKFQRRTTAVGETEDVVPVECRLGQNFPNPFNPTTTIRYSVPPNRGDVVAVKVYDILGREIAVLAQGPHAAGVYAARWDASAAASGVYFCRMTSGDFTATMKMLLVK